MRAAITTILIAAMLGGGGAFLWRYYGGFEHEQAGVIAFIDVYGEYADVAQEVERLVHIPGTEGNTDRAELLSLLTSMLTDSIDNARREELARLAFSNLNALKEEVDAAQIAQARLYEALQKLDSASRQFKGVGLQKEAAEIVAAARKRAEISARITSVLSEMNEQTYAIITQILADGGALTASHVQHINDTTFVAEERSAVLSGLYSELEQKKGDLQTSFSAFARNAV